MEVWMECFYKTPKGIETRLETGMVDADQVLPLVEDMEKTGRIKGFMIEDEIGNVWTPKEFNAYIKEVETEPYDVKVYFDGGFDKETKKSGLGCVIYFEQSGKSLRLRKNASVDELDTNNEAEYAALHLAVKELEGLGVHHQTVLFVGDSQVVIRQMSGEWPCYEATLNKWADRIDADLKRLGIRPIYKDVSRKDNREADQLATQALNGTDISSLK